MRKNSRAGKIYAAGVAEAEEIAGGEISNEWHTMLSAMAVMIDHATAKKKPEKKPPLLFTEKDVLQALPIEVAVARHGGLNRQLGKLELLSTDLDQFITWFTESMLPWLQSKDVEFTYSMLVRKFPEWLERSRQYSGNASGNASEAWR